MTVFRIRFEIAGGHVHCALFAGKATNQTFAKCGDFTVRKGEEFRDLLEQFKTAEAYPINAADTVAEACRQ